MALSLEEFFYGCVISENKEMFSCINNHLIAQAETHANNDPYMLADFLWANMKSYEKKHINNYMNDFLSEHKETNKTKKNEPKIWHIRSVDLSNRTLGNLYIILDNNRLYSSSYINLSGYTTKDSLKQRILNFSPYDKWKMREKLHVCSIVINEILHRKGFWDKYLNFNDRDNLIAFCIFAKSVICQDILDGNHEGIAMLIKTKKYLPMYDIIHETLAFP